jgi:hypothetical protein
MTQFSLIVNFHVINRIFLLIDKYLIMDTTASHFASCHEQFSNWVIQEGWLRMAEHIFVLIVVVRLLTRALTI